MREAIKRAVFYTEQSPGLLTDIIMSIIKPVELTGDVLTSGVNVPVGTTLTDAINRLPTTSVSFGVGSVPGSADVSWGSTTTPSYDDTTPGNYVLTGSLSNLSSNVVNTGGFSVIATITVK